MAEAKTPVFSIVSTFRGVVSLLVVVAATFTLAGFFARYDFRFELTTHFAVLLAACTLLAAIVLVILRRPWFAALAAVVAVVNFAQFAGICLPTGATPTAAKTYRCVSANVLTSNRDKGKFLAFIHQEKPDFFVVMEIDEAWQTGLEELTGDYPHQIVQPRDDNFGIGLYSSFPITSHSVESVGGSGAPTIVAVLETDGGPLTVIATHPLPPMRADTARSRNEQLAAVAELAAERTSPVMLMGDLNVTPTSPYFRDLLADSKLADSRQGFGLQGSWPATNPSLLRIPIDHVLVSGDIAVVDRRLGKDVGSDHLPVIVEFELGEGDD